MPPREYKKGQEAFKAVQDNFEEYRARAEAQNFQGAEKPVLDNARLLRIEDDGTVVWEIFLPPVFHHVAASLHGGSAALILDQLTSLSVAPHAAPGYWARTGGVTRTFVVTCLRPAKLNTTVNVRCKVVAIGSTAILLHGSIVSPDGKQIFNTMEHNKVNVALKKDAPSPKL